MTGARYDEDRYWRVPSQESGTLDLMTGRYLRGPAGHHRSAQTIAQPVAQVAPLRVNAVGAVLVAPLLAMNPTVTEPPAAMVLV